MAPELTEPNEKNKFRVGRKCDIYSLGVLIMAIVIGENPPHTHDTNGVNFIGKVSDHILGGSYPCSCTRIIVCQLNILLRIFLM